MKRPLPIKLILLGIVALAAELTVLSDFSFLGGRVELLYMLCCFSALHMRTPRDVALSCWTLGLIKGFGHPGPLGLHALFFLATGMLVLRTRQTLFREHPLIQVAVTATGTLIMLLADGFLSAFLLGAPAPGTLILGAFSAAVMTALAAPFCFAFITGPHWLLGEAKT